MEALDALLNRVSVPRLVEPAPSAEQRDVMYRVALRAPDHGQLRPWRFLSIEGESLNRLGELYAQAVGLDQNASSESIEKARLMPLRAPLIVVVIACPKEHPKVPEVEQLMAASCAAHGMLLAAHAQGVGAVWRTGAMAYDAHVAAGLGLSGAEQIVGYLYLGMPERELRKAQPLDPADFVSNW